MFGYTIVKIKYLKEIRKNWSSLVESVDSLRDSVNYEKSSAERWHTKWSAEVKENEKMKKRIASLNDKVTSLNTELNKYRPVRDQETGQFIRRKERADA